MALYQNTSVDSDKLVIGNYKIEVATVGTTVGSAWTNLGAGIINSFGHNITRYEVQAGNAPDPLEGVASETFSISGELIEYDAANVVSAYGGIMFASTTTTTLSIVTAGGAAEMTPKAFKLTNRRLVNGVSQETVILVYKAYMVNGPQFTAKSDNDADPINTMTFEIQGEIDGSRTTGDQLYSIRKWLD